MLRFLLSGFTLVFSCILFFLPSSLLQAAEPAYRLALGANHSCVHDDNGIHCWGSNSEGQIQVPADLADPEQLSAWGSRTCVSVEEGTLCWGSNRHTRAEVFSGEKYAADGTVFQGYMHSCSLDDAGVHCWGRNDFGQTEVPPDLRNPRQIALGFGHTCVIDDAGVRCWGDNSSGQSSSPENLQNPLRIAAGGAHTCVLDDTGVHCWGGNLNDQIVVPSWLQFVDFDGDGVINKDDDLPNHEAASVDTDNDGQPDRWDKSCGQSCQLASGLIIDSDNDNDGVPNELDDFPEHNAASTDTDDDGYPDSWNESCDLVCQKKSGLIQDSDNDNDGVNNENDAFPLSENASVDADHDGLPDVCADNDCGSLKQDPSLNDTDNDGLPNGQDTVVGDNLAPEIISVPDNMSVNATESGNTVQGVDIDLDQLRAHDIVSDHLIWHMTLRGVRQPLSADEFSVILPSGRNILTWEVSDEAGNTSSQEQIVDIYPTVEFEEAASVVGEASEHVIGLRLTGESPVYPVHVYLMAEWSESDATLHDISAGSVSDNLQLVEILSSDDPEKKDRASIALGIKDDGILEENEVLILDIRNATAELSDQDDSYQLRVLAEKKRHVLTITDNNLPPEIRLSVQQGEHNLYLDQGVLELTIGDAQTVIEAHVTDPNGSDTLSTQWDSSEFLVQDNRMIIGLQNLPESMEGDYPVIIKVADDGDPEEQAELTFTIRLRVPVVSPAPPEEADSDDNRSSSGGALYAISVFWLMFILAVWRRKLILA